jgi:hypothetical protein
MFRYKTATTKDLFHIVPMALMDSIQATYLASKDIDKACTMKTYKTLLGAQKAVSAGYVIVWEKSFYDFN